MPRWARESYGFAREVIREFDADDCMSTSASLAYYTVFSLAPLLLIVIVAAGLVMTPVEATTFVHGEFQGMLGQEGADQIRIMVDAVQERPSGSRAARVLGVVAALFGATGVMLQLQSSVNRAWGVTPDPKRGGIRNFLLKRVLSLGMILAIAFLLLVSLVLTAVFTAIATRAGSLLPDGISAFTLESVNFVVSLIFVTALFGAIYKWMPDAIIRWRDVAVGATFTGLLFTIGKMLIGLYLGHSGVATAYGAASSLAIVFVWVYYSSVIVMLGAEFTQVWAHRYGGGLKPTRGATVVVKDQRRPSGASPS